MMIIKRGIIVLFIICFTAGNAIAATDQVVINSADWQDVYSGALFAGLEGIPVKFLVTSEQAPILISSLERSRQNILLIESSTQSLAFGYKNSLEAANFNVEEIAKSNVSLNIDLAKKAKIKQFIIVDDSYGYNAISVTPYAVKNKYFVLLANNKNGDELYSFLKSNQVEKLIIYGYLDNDLKQKLAEFKPEIINKGNRFDNNLEMVERFGPTQQIIFTNGEFIESEIMSGKEPVIFVGKENVPYQVIDYIKRSYIKTGIVIGNDLVGSSHQIKEATNVTIFLKFGQGIGSIGSSEVKALDVFQIPVYDTNIKVQSIKYNSETRSLEVTYQNNGKIGTYFRSSIELFSSGTRIATVGDTEPVFVNRENTLTISYNKDISEQSLNSKVTILFGEFPASLDRVIRVDLPVEHISIKDSSNLSISGATYGTDLHELKIGLKNTGEVPAYGKTQVTFVKYGEETVVTQDKPIYLEPGASEDVVFITTLSDTNINENKKVKVKLNFGERESALIKVLESNPDLEKTNMSTNIIVVILAAFLIIGIIYYSRKDEKVIKSSEPKEKTGNKESVTKPVIHPYPVNSNPVNSNPVNSNPVNSNPVNSNPVNSNPMNNLYNMENLIPNNILTSIENLSSIQDPNLKINSTTSKNLVNIESPEDILKKANHLFYDGKIPEAIGSFDDLIRIKQSNSTGINNNKLIRVAVGVVLHAWGLMLIKLGKIEDAKKCYNKEIEVITNDYISAFESNDNKATLSEKGFWLKAAKNPKKTTKKNTISKDNINKKNINAVKNPKKIQKNTIKKNKEAKVS